MPSISRSEANLLWAAYAFLVGVVTVWIGIGANNADTPLGWIIFWCTGTLTLAAMPRMPAVALGAFVALAYAMPRYSTPYDTLTKLGVLDWVCGLAVIGGLIAWVSQSRELEKPSWLVWIMAAFVAWLALTLGVSLAHGTGWHAYAPGHHPVQQFFQALVMFLLAAYYMARPLTVWLFALTLCLALCVRSFLQGSEGISLENDLAALLAIALPLAVLGAWIARPVPIRFGFVVLGGIMLWVLIKTQNRAGLVALVVPLPILWMQTRHKVWVFVAAIPVLLGAGALFAVTGYQRFAGLLQGSADASAASRVYLAWAGWKMFLDHPLFGVGPGNFTRFVNDYGDIPTSREAHNNYAQILAESGAPGLALYVTLFGGALVILWRTAQRAGRDWPAPGARLVLGSLCAYLVIGCFLSRHDMVLAYLLAGWAVALHSELSRPRAEQTKSGGPSFTSGGVAELAAAFAALSGKVVSPAGDSARARPHAPPHAPTPSGSVRLSLAPPVGPNLALWLTGALVLLLLYSALIPFQVDWNGLQWEAIQQKANWKPYDDPTPSALGLPFNVLNALANAAAGVVLGWLAFLACPRRWPGGAAWLLAVGIAALTAFGMEALQLVVPPRDVTMTDVANIALGGGCGALAAWGFAGPAGDWLKVPSLSALLARPGWLALVLWLAFLGLRSFFPDAVAASVGDLKETVKRVNLIPGKVPGMNLFTQLHQLGLRTGEGEPDLAPVELRWTRTQYLASLAGQALLFALIGACLQRVRGRSAVSLPGTAVILGLLAVGVECGKVFFPSQIVDVNTALASMAGGCLGAVVWLLLGRQTDVLRWIYPATVVAYVVTQFLAQARSLHDVAGHAAYNTFVPFAVYRGSPDALRILPDLLQGVGLFVPVGWLAAQGARRQWPGKNYGMVLATVASAILAGGLMIVQAALGRIPTIDDVIWAGLGGMIGSWLQASLGRQLEVSKTAWR